MDLIPYPREEKLRPGVTSGKIPGTKISRDFHSQVKLGDGSEVIPFTYYLDARGWDTLSFTNGTFLETENSRSEEWLAMLQCWFVWGSVENVADRKIAFSKLTRVEDDGETYLDMAQLPKILDRGITDLLSGSGNEIRERVANICTALNQVNRGLRFFCATEDSLRDSSRPLDPLPRTMSQTFGSRIIAYSRELAVIGSTIAEYLMERREDKNPEGLVGLEGLSLLRWPELDDELLPKIGWCAFTARLLTSRFSINIIEYASRFTLKGRWGSTKEHPGCTVHSCVVQDLPAGTRSCIRHEPKFCTQSAVLGASPPANAQVCRNLTPDLNAVFSALLNGSYPLMEFDVENEELRVVPYDISGGGTTTTTQYVAISHVWAEGLGSYSELGLPLCQIRRISSIIHQIAHSSRSPRRLLFWIDGLCIPESTDLRKKAVIRMADTYRNAELVLVIDRCIERLSVADPIEEILLAINISSWMQRLWTLQEGILARLILWKLSDGTIANHDLGERIMEPRVDESTSIVPELSSPIRPFLFPPPQDETVFWDVAVLMLWRRTSRPSDELLALGSILDLDLSKYINLRGEERMIQFLVDMGSRGEIKSNILFSPAPSRLKTKGFRWALASFMGCGEVSPFGEPAMVTHQGLKSSYHAVVFHRPLLKSVHHVFTLDIEDHAGGEWQKTYEVMNRYDTVQTEGGLGMGTNLAETHQDLEPDLILLECSALLDRATIKGTLVKLEDGSILPRGLTAADTLVRVQFCGAVRLVPTYHSTDPRSADTITGDPTELPSQDAKVRVTGRVLEGNFLVT